MNMKPIEQVQQLLKALEHFKTNDDWSARRRSPPDPAACGLASPLVTLPAWLAGRPIVIAYHLIWTLYGWWLPNDPRGSGSQHVASDLLAQLGKLHHGRRRAQPAGHVVREFYAQAAERLNHPLHVFEPSEFAKVAQALGDVIIECTYTCYACAIMPDHVHLLIRKHRDDAETMIERLQTLSRKRLADAGVRQAGHPTWSEAAGRSSWTILTASDVPSPTLSATPPNADCPRSAGHSSHPTMAGPCIPVIARIPRMPARYGPPGDTHNRPAACGLASVGHVGRRAKPPPTACLAHRSRHP
jgi:REP element-mobilizing transposase RayT